MTEIIDIANKVIDTYCADMGVPREKLSENKTKKKARKHNHINLSFMRQSLGHYLYKRLPLMATEIGQLIGYADHCMVSLYSRIVENHIEIDDKVFMPYYFRLVELADPIVQDVNFERTSAWFWRSVDKKVLKIRSVRDFSL